MLASTLFNFKGTDINKCLLPWSEKSSVSELTAFERIAVYPKDKMFYNRTSIKGHDFSQQNIGFCSVYSGVLQGIGDFSSEVCQKRIAVES
jgi:hypothetical protein